MRIAIVGSSLIYEREVEAVKKLVSQILEKYKPIETTVISGGAEGVDKIALDVALISGFAIKPIMPMGVGWEFFKKRNLEIVEDCKKLYCISTSVHFMKCYHHETLQDHEKTAGCWTLNKAKEENKPTELLLIPEIPKTTWA